MASTMYDPRMRMGAAGEGGDGGVQLALSSIAARHHIATRVDDRHDTGAPSNSVIISASSPPPNPNPPSPQRDFVSERSPLYPVIYVKDEKLWVKHPPHYYHLRSEAMRIGGKYYPHSKAY